MVRRRTIDTTCAAAMAMTHTTIVARYMAQLNAINVIFAMVTTQLVATARAFQMAAACMMRATYATAMVHLV
jgi:hypothetical protein